MRRFAAVCLAMIALAGCDPALVDVSTTSLGDGFYAIVRADRAGTRFTILESTPIRIDAWTAQLNMDLASETLVLVEVESAAASEIALRPIEERATGTRTNIPVADASVITLSQDGQTFAAPDREFLLNLQSKLHLETVAAAADCAFDGPRQVTSFGPDAALIPEATCGGPIVAIQALDEDTAVVAAGGGLNLVRRGEAFDCAGVAPSGRPVRVGPGRMFSIAPDVLPDGGRRVTFIFGFEVGDTTVYPDGFGPVTTATTVDPMNIPEVTRPAFFNLKHVLHDTQGQTIVTGDEGFVLIRNGDGPFRSYTFETDRIGGVRTNIDRAASNPNPAAPHAFATAKGVYVGDFAAGRFERLPGVVDGLGGTEITGLKVTEHEGETEYWMTADDRDQGRIYRTRASTGTQVALLNVPEELRGCLSFDGRSLLSDIPGLMTDGNFVFIPTDCNAVLRIRRTDFCVAPITVNPMFPLGRGGARGRSIARTDNQLLLGVGDGGFFRWDL